MWQNCKAYWKERMQTCSATNTIQSIMERRDDNGPVNKINSIDNTKVLELSYILDNHIMHFTINGSIFQ